jgi:hypothetical protein
MTRAACIVALLGLAAGMAAAQPAADGTGARAAADGAAGSGPGGAIDGHPFDPPPADFYALVSLDEATAGPARERIAALWRNGYASIVLDLLDLLQRTSMVNPASWVRLSRVASFLEEQTGQSFGADVNAWRRWVWSLPYEPHAEYGRIKGELLAGLDKGFADFFRPPVESAIRLDEIQWGGVTVNGIPPLDHPKVLPAAEADYLDDGNVVFGIAVNGEARAYPKRILAWHELALDRVGGEALTVVYCTLCGTVIPFRSEVGGKERVFGTSGLLYQSNKLMFDAETRSLWSSLTGRPVVGPLTGSGLELEALPVVTTSWGEWRALHPDTTVLSLDTGYQRDYSEGAAYRSYFGTDALMFDVSMHDARLPNKAEVLTLSLAATDAGGPQTVAISADLLARERVYAVELADPDLVVVTSAGGANRVYQSGAQRFDRLDAAGRLLDTQGRSWNVTESALVAGFEPGLELPRVPAHRSFWFGWFAQHPDTRLMH